MNVVAPASISMVFWLSVRVNNIPVMPETFSEEYVFDLKGID